MSCVEYKGKAYTREQFAKLLVDGELSNLIGDLKPVIKLEPKIDESDKLKTLVDKAKASLSKILPNVKIILHNTEDEYEKAVGESLSGGAFMNNNIHINPAKSNSRTVAHEVFHAILLGIVKSDPAAQRITAAMIAAIEKVLPPDMKAKLQDFVENGYDDQKQLWDEEKLAELVGYLADNYPKLTLPAQNIIKTWLDKLAKLVGLKEFTDKEVIDFMNTISGKVASGEVITEKDVEILSGGKKIANPFDYFKRKQVGAFDVKYTEQERLDQLIKDKLVTEPENTDFMSGNNTAITSPDDMLVGSISIDGKEIFEGGGGVFFVTKYGDVWASGNEGTANTLANAINKSLELNKGKKGYLTLTKGSNSKLISSSSGVKSSLSILESMLDKGLISNSDFRSAVSSAVRSFGGEISLKGSAKQLKEDVDKYFSNPKESTFQKRGDVLKKIIETIAQSKNTKANKDKIIDFLGGDKNKGLVSKVTSENKNRNQSLSDLIAGVASEKLTKGLNVGDVYAIIEVDGNVMVKEDSHPSYPFHVVQVNGKNPILHLPKNRENGSKTITTSTGKPYTVGQVSIMSGSFNSPVRKQMSLESDKDYKPGYEAALNELNETEEQRETWRSENKVNQKQKRNPVVEQAVKDYYNENINQEEYLDIVSKNQPIKPFKTVPDLPTLEEIVNSLDKSKVATGIIGLTKGLKDGERVASRLDIPAYEDFDTWVVSVHDGNKEGKSIAYGQTAVLKNVDFKTFPGPAIRIAMGTQSKSTIARMFGDWVNEDPKLVHDRAKELMNDPAWTQVGMNPFRYSWFYDKSDGMPLASAEEVVQVGALVLAKNAVKVSPSDSMFETKSSKGTPIRFQRTQPRVKKMYEDSNKAIRDMEKTRGVKEFFNDVYKRIFDRQKNIKDLITSFGNKSSIKAYNRLVTKTGASGFASLEFKEASKKIYDKLNKSQLEILDQLIYARRIKAINEARIRDGRPIYKGKDGYSLNEANEDLKIIKDQIGDKEFNNLNDRATEYFYQYKKSLRDLYDSGRINKETYDKFKNDEYSPIRTIKYVLSPNTSTEEIDMEAKRFGMAKKDIMKLSDENANDVIMDSKWLLAMTINANKSRAFENKMLDEFNKAFENLSENEKESISEYIVENPVIGKKQDGSLKYKYDSVTLPDGFVKVSFFENGNKKDIIINKKYADQLLDVKNKHLALEFVGAITGGQILRFFATGGNPLFVFGNIANDFQNILLNTSVYSEFLPLASIQIARDFVKNFVKKAVLNDTYNKSYRDYVSHGGALDMMSRDGLKALESINIPSKMVSGTKKGLLAYGHFISFLGGTSEVAFRLSVFDKYKEKLVKEFEKQNGRTPNNEELDDIMWDAARESRETMPFDQGGDLTKAANIVMPYLNAQMQALRKTLVFAAKNPKRMAKNVLQYTLMSSTLSAASFAMLLRGLGDDDDDDKKKLNNMIDAWKSISDYEKANYHIIFTGNKDKDGEFEYYRVKKLPIFSILSTAAEELILKTFLASKGVDYEISGDAVKESAIKSIPLPIDVQEWLGKNPAAGALISYWANKDTFTGEEIFRQPRGKKILPEAEINNKTNELYKDLGSATGLSPARSKVAIEKIITSETTNPTIPLMYSAYDGLFHKKDGLGKEVSDAMSAVGDAFGRKLVRYTDKNVLRYKKQDEIEYKESVIETEIWKKEQEMYDEIKDVYDSGKKLTGEQFKEMLTSKFEPKDIAKYDKKYKAYINNRGADREILDIIFEDVPEVQAMKLNERYGNSFEGDEIKELMSTASRSGRKINNQAMSIYYDKYVKRKATN